MHLPHAGPLALGLRSRPLQEQLAQVVSGNSVTSLRERDEVAAVPAAGVMDASTGMESEQGEDALHLGGGTLGRPEGPRKFPDNPVWKHGPYQAFSLGALFLLARLFVCLYAVPRAPLGSPR
jgi:hypothetical protein